MQSSTTAIGLARRTTFTSGSVGIFIMLRWNTHSGLKVEHGSVVYLCVYFLKIVKVKVCSNMWNRKGDSRQNKSSLSLSVGLGAGLGGRQTEQTKWFFFHTAL